MIFTTPPPTDLYVFTAPHYKFAAGETRQRPKRIPFTRVRDGVKEHLSINLDKGQPMPPPYQNVHGPDSKFFGWTKWNLSPVSAGTDYAEVSGHVVGPVTGYSFKRFNTAIESFYCINYQELPSQTIVHLMYTPADAWHVVTANTAAKDCNGIP